MNLSLSSEQQEYIIPMFRLFKDGDLSVLQIESDTKFCPLSQDAPECQAVCTQIFSTIVSALRKDVALPAESTETFLDYMVTESVNSSSHVQIASLSRIVASIINKWKDGKKLISLNSDFFFLHAFYFR